ncbi:MAG: protein translocase subunit SecD [Candidatus Harrisonbacteria bacterium CG10_big_fil_rev_8_21_14_0_10_42_17]|uniref:Protein translocase subunit SecD n=1 Tax=Candidatus Harrisonbacteria bacterium CG10_big_fil_rev_8_21_14_0_10_42_17 TaxID=1974584 RepID=A0A2M6WHY5_9BACT|nr:MAG: protein translocase subunit SecD [Candidatus Harrisonbacteria bacterium CG10_big_fil_rev_8_21_14_0_10_42_17]
MEAKKKARIFLGIIALITIVGGVFVWPSGFGEKQQPWKFGLDLVGGSHLVYEVDMSDVASADRTSVLNGLRDVIERRINLFGVSEPRVVTAKKADTYRIIVELAGIKDVSQAIAEIGETPFLIFKEVKELDEGENPDELTSEQLDALFIDTELTGRYVEGAQVVIDSFGRPQISLSFSKEGGALFEELTGRNINRPIAIFVDNELISAPNVNEKITGGRAQITGNFTLEEAKLLVERFNAGALPAPITLINQQTIGASLGADSLARTIYAGIIGTMLVMLFMLVYYGKLGVHASIALIIYIVLTLFVFKAFGITMTLAGIAGIVLSIGIAVDANILIFERMEEEMKQGKEKAKAIEEGFKRAWLSIRDSNITTIITSIILYYFTTGFIKGFALALLIGVLVSMFSAITVTRNLLRATQKTS